MAGVGSIPVGVGVMLSINLDQLHLWLSVLEDLFLISGIFDV